MSFNFLGNSEVLRYDFNRPNMVCRSKIVQKLLEIYCERAEIQIFGFIFIESVKKIP